MLVVSNRFHVHEDHVEEFEERFRNRMGEVESMDGFVRFEFHRPVDHGHIDTGTHAAVTYWESMDAFEAWTESEAFREAHRNPAPEEWFEQEGNVEIHEVGFDAGGDR
ncbi:antibiotic biosynthesis monooxygenase [Halorubellus litoreus]|uniref:Antibiotic biosynthesis monooxygenase family protein n=1 Tax=Halorubellus litoreus TaxID=755308 RepID=A0ABD5VG47_9EURY